MHSGDDRIQLKELMEICTNLQNRVFHLENTKTAQAHKIDSLKRSVKKLERRQKSKTPGLKRLFKVGLSARVESSDEESLGKENASKQGRNIADNDTDKEITIVDETVEDQGRFGDHEMFDTGVLDDEEIVIEKAVADKEVSAVEEVNAVSITTPVSTATTTTTAATTPTIYMDEITLAKVLIEIKTSRPKAKGIVMQETSETPTPTLIVSFQQPSKVQDKGETCKGENESNNSVIEQWNDVQAKIDADYELTQRLTWMDESPKNLKNKSFDDIQDLFNKVMKRVNMFVDMDIEVVESSKKTEEIAQEGSSKRAVDELEQEIAKK
nr:hypothetical protein [Tanacetum cinerariifolium]